MGGISNYIKYPEIFFNVFLVEVNNINTFIKLRLYLIENKNKILRFPSHPEQETLKLKTIPRLVSGVVAQWLSGC